ncbi:uncharacterized protein [Ranitomeya imitator]|uniref:uncharacterized protein isoform X2 n=1 Tax=Ranitomeya imitator TaxID=111125 RepID=UPI0037E92252
MEEWEYLEGHQDRYQNVMMEERRPLTPRDGSRRGNPPENHNISEDHQGEDLIDINVEVKDEVEETMDVWADQQDGSRRRNPPERCPRPLYPQDCPEKNRNIPEDHQREDLISIKVEENLEEAMRGGQPCMNVVKEETPDVTTELRMMGSQETCPLCSCEVEDDGERVVIGAKGAEGINNASIERGVSTVVAAGAVVHKRCRMNYINKKQIELHKKATSVHRSPAKRAFYSNMSSTEDLAQSGQDTNEMSDSEGSSSSSVSAVFSQSESSDPEPARPPPKKVSKKDTSGVEQPEQLSDDSSQGRRARVPEVERRRVPQREEANTIDNEQLIHLVQERRALWDTRHRQHSDSVVIRRLWEEVARSLLTNWDRATTQVRKDFLKSVKVHWRSMKDRFNKDMREEIKVRSGAAPKLPKYKYHRMLAFLRPALAHRPTWSSTTEPGSSSVAVARQRPATERSQSSTSNAVTGQASQAGEQAASPSGFPLSQPSSTAFVGTSRQRQRAWERSVMPEFIHLSSVFQDGMKVTGDRIDSVFTQVNTLLQDVHRQLDRLKADLQRPAQHFLSAIERGVSENLTPELQLNVMLACQAAYSQALQQSRSYHPQAGYYQQANIYFPT